MKSRPVWILLAERSIFRPPPRQRGCEAPDARGAEEANELAGVLEYARGRRGMLWPEATSPANEPPARERYARLWSRRPQHPSPNTPHILWAANPARS